MKRINFLLIAFSLFIFTSCEQEEYEFGDILSPTNLTISASLQGADADNPYGDGMASKRIIDFLKKIK